MSWRDDKFTKHILCGHSAQTWCVKFYKNWILTGSEDCTIRIWDSETFECLRVIGEPDPEFFRGYYNYYLTTGIDASIL